MTDVPLFRRPKDDTAGGATDAWAARLEAALTRSYGLHAGLTGPRALPAPLARDAVAFVRTGSPRGALGAVAAHQAALTASGVVYGRDHAPAIAPLVAGLFALPADALARWGQLVETAVPGVAFQLYELDPVGGSRWPELVLRQVRAAYLDEHERLTGGALDRVPVPVDALENALAAGGVEPLELWRAAFRDPTDYSYATGVRAALAAMVGYAPAVVRHADALVAQLQSQGAASNLAAVEMLGPLPDEVLRRFAPALAAMVTAGSSQVRTAVVPLGARCAADLEAPLRERAVSAAPEARRHALRALWDRGDADLRAWVSETAAADRAASVRALAEEWARPLSEATDDGEDAASLAADAARPPLPWLTEVTAEGVAQLEALRRLVNEAIRTHNERERDLEATIAKISGARPAPAHLVSELPGSWARDMARELAGPAPAPRREQFRALVEPAAFAALGAGLGFTAALRVHMALDGVLDHRGHVSGRTAEVVEALHAQTGGPTLLELSDVFDAMGLDGPGEVVLRASTAWGAPLGAGWPDADVVPFVRLHSGRFTALLSPPHGDYSTSVSAAIRALGRLPVLPDQVGRLLFDFALTGLKAHRQVAREACARMGDRDARLVTALSDGKADVRTEAARWLASLRPEAAVPALEAAVAKERHDVAKGAMLDALEAAGRPVERYLDRAALAADAAKGLAKGLPKDLGWLRWDAVPEVRWADSGEVVPTASVQWLVAQAVRAKSPEPNAVLRKYCGMLESTSREAFGQHLLEAWLAADTRPVDPQRAAATATERAQELHRAMRQWPQAYADDPRRSWSVEELATSFLPGCLREPAGSEIASKGVLAVVAACAGERAAAPVGVYLKEWYGTRAAQGKALIGMLAWIDHPTATQLMLSVGSRFRTKSFQDEATRQAEAMAERKGWTVAELADRTIPTAGLDETGTLELSYGHRTFRAVLAPDLTLVLHGPDGEPVRALPAPRQSDDAERAAAAKQTFAGAKKQLGTLVTMQTERLYEAMCTERTWPYDDWDRYLARHPVMRHLVQRVVWTATTLDGVTTAFRPLDDGTLTGVDDAEVQFPAEAVVRVAHGSALTAADLAAWQAHLDDYEVAPLFRQLSAGAAALGAGEAGRLEVTDFRGHLVEAFRLRSRATKLGYTRGAPGDGGWFTTYEKRFPTIGITTVVQFSGNSLPEENRTVALEALSFERLMGESWNRPRIRLADVPRVLLDEAYADVRAMAADGTGYDPEWEKKVAP